jgi:hypothetical protein
MVVFIIDGFYTHAFCFLVPSHHFPILSLHSCKIKARGGRRGKPVTVMRVAHLCLGMSIMDRVEGV